MATKRYILKSEKVFQSYFGANSAEYSTAKLSIDLSVIDRLDRSLCAVEGQDFAVQAVKEYLFGKNRERGEKGPLGTMLFAGAPAVGKTFMAEKIAEALGYPYLRLDMSSFNDKEAMFDFTGMNPSYKSAAPGALTKFVYENPVSVVLLDEVEKAHPNVLRQLLQILERGEIQDMCMQRQVNFRNAIIIMTTNVGAEIYDGSAYRYNLSRTPQAVIVNALKTERNPVYDMPCFSGALVSRFASGRIILFNKLRPEIIHRIAVKAINEKVQKYYELYRITFELNADLLADLLIFSLGEQADVRAVLKAVNSFFERNVQRAVREVKDGGYTTFFDRFECAVSFDNADAEAKNLFFPDTPARILVYSGADLKVGVKDGKSPFAEYVIADKSTDLKGLSALDLSAAVVEVKEGDNFSRELFSALTEADDCPVFVYDLSAKSPAAFCFYNDNGASGCYSPWINGEDFGSWLDGIVRGTRLSAITRALFKSNKVVKFETYGRYRPKKHVYRLEIRDICVANAINAADSGKFASPRSMSTVKFTDVIGGDEAKEELIACIKYLKNPKKYIRAGIRIPRGLLLEGEPGTGKTMLAKALANAADVPFISTNATEFLQKYVGEGAKRLRETFAAARKYAPAILFIDEVDCIAKSRAGEEGRHTQDVTNAFLSELDGFSNNDFSPVFVICATNFSTRKGETELDEAFLRRFDRRIRVDLPDRAQRELFLTVALSKFAQSAVTKDRIASVVSRSIGWSLADLNLVVQNAIRTVDLDGDGKLTDGILDEAFESFNSGKAKAASPDKLKKTAYHEAGHAVAAAVLGFTPEYATVSARADYGGYVYLGDEDRTEYTKSELLNRICISLAGRAGEVMLYGEDGVTTGASSDLKQALSLAGRMVCEYGMDEFLVCPDPKSAEAVARIRSIVAGQYQRAQQLLAQNRTAVDAVAGALITENRLDGARIKRLVEGK